MECRAVSDRGVVWLGQPRGLPVRDAGARARAVPRRPGARADARPRVPPADDPARSGARPGADRAVACHVCRPWPGADVVARGLCRRAGLPCRAAGGHLLRPVGRHDRGRRASLGDLARGAGLGRGHVRLVGAPGDRLPPLPRVRADRAPTADRAERDPDAGRARHLVAAGTGRPLPARPVTARRWPPARSCWSRSPRSPCCWAPASRSSRRWSHTVSRRRWCDGCATCRSWCSRCAFLPASRPTRS